MLSLLLSAHNEKIITVYQNVSLQVLVEEMTRRCHASGKSSILQNLSVMLSPSLGCVQRSAHRLWQFPSHTWLLCLGVFVWQSDVDVADRISVEVGSTSSMEIRKGSSNRKTSSWHVERENSSVESILSLQELCKFTTDFR